MTHLRVLPAIALLQMFRLGASEPDHPVRFVDVTASAGIAWSHDNGATPERYLIETMGGGGAFLDYDNDGWMDIYLVNSGSHAKSAKPSSARNALYRNRGDGTFEDVTARAGVAGRGYGMGVAVGDYDNDGFSDIYVTHFGPNILYRNRGDGTFQDVTAAARVSLQEDTQARSNPWSTSAAFFDLENDGDLDLFVCVYLDWNYEKNIYCGDKREGMRSYCHPDYFGAVSSRLLRNDGGAYVDATDQLGVSLPGKALGVVTGDINGDGLSDLYVANDAVANYLYVNKAGKAFEETGLISEVAYGTTVKPESGMGTDFGDFDGDGRIDLIVTNIDYEMNNLYSNQGGGFFNDVTIRRQLGQIALPYSGFGVRFIDYDNDGDLDLVVLNGHVSHNIEHYKSGIQYAEPPLILANVGSRFLDASEQSGEVWKRPLVGRALASGDYDNDGDIDLLFVNNGQPPLLLRNDGGSRGRWLGLELRGSKSNRDAVGSLVSVQTNKRRLVRQIHGGGSYHAAHDLRLVFGLLEDESVTEIEVRWPSGAKQTVGPVLGRYTKVEENE